MGSALMELFRPLGGVDLEVERDRSPAQPPFDMMLTETTVASEDTDHSGAAGEQAPRLRSAHNSK